MTEWYDYLAWGSFFFTGFVMLLFLLTVILKG